MRAYLMTTGILFAVLVLAHAWRAAAESNLVRDPWFVLFTVLAASLSVWAFRLLRRLPRDSAGRAA
jgi:hypothetical protein